MEDTMVYKKRIKIYTGIAMVVNYLIYLAQNFISFKFLSAVTPEEAIANQSWSSLLNLAYFAIIFAMFFFVGKALTKGKTKAIMYASSAYLSFAATGTITSLVSKVFTILLRIGAPLSAMDSATIMNVAKFLCVPLQIVLTYVIFTSLEGINEKLGSRGIGNFETTAKQAKKNYVIYYILSLVVTLVFSNGTSFIMALLGPEMASKNISYILLQISSYISEVLPLIILYLIGYRSQKSHQEAMAFSAVHFLAIRIANLITDLPTTATLFVRNAFVPEDVMSNTNQYTAVSSISGAVISAISLVGLVITFIVIFRMFNIVFAKKETAADEETEEASAEEKSMEEESAEEISTEDASVEEVSTEEVSVQETAE